MMLKRWFCRHKNHEAIRSECLGAHLSWAAQPEPITRYTMRCKDCGKQWQTQGYVPRHIARMLGQKYDETGWPLDESGERLGMAP
jgi:hypothetical protein